MMRARAVIRTLPALIALLLLGAWLGSSVLHQHLGPPCQICKDLQASQLDLTSPGDTPSLDAPSERFAEACTPDHPTLLLAAPSGRGPPQA